MSRIPHDLHEDFPQMSDEIHKMKSSDAHFARLVEEYNSVNKRIHRAEAEGGAPDQETDLRRSRMILKDQISRMLSGAAPLM